MLLLSLPWPREHLLVIVFAGLVVAAAAALGGYRYTGRITALTAGVGLAAGMLHASTAIQNTLAMRLPGCIDDDYRSIVVRITSDPVYQPAVGGRPASAKFVAELIEADHAVGCPARSGVRLQLSWYQPPELRRKDLWRLQTRLRPPWGYQNPGGFDYERWLFAKKLHGTGYVRSGVRLSLKVSNSSPPAFSSFLEANGTSHRGMILALTRGDGSALSSDQWDLFRATGTVHLMVVSGLHVAMVTALCFWLLAAMLRLLPTPLNDQRVAAILALGAAAGFVWSTGAGVPAVRAWIMAAAVLLPTLAGRRVSKLAVFCLAVAVVLLMEPLAAHQQGFFLSFGAAGVLLWFFSREGPRRWPGIQLLLTQLLLFICLTPLLALQQAQVAGISSLSNLVVVPLLSLVLPLALSILLLWSDLPGMATGVLFLLDQLLSCMLWLLGWFSRAPLLNTGSGDPLRIVLAALASWLLLSRAPLSVAGISISKSSRYPGRLLWSLLLALSWMAWTLPGDAEIRHGEFRVMALDVGQGSAIFVDTNRHRLLFDTGPAYPGGFNLGQAAVLPSLIRSGVAKIDVLVLSHDDLDHTGGAAALLESVPVHMLYGSFSVAPAPAGRVSRLSRCQQGISWHWDGVRFEFLNSPVVEHQTDNDRSCVLKISSATRAALISGDISAAVEERLLSRADVAADLVFAPHHGSQTSSSRRWIASVEPAWVLVSAPRRSRYGHPHPDVLQRYLDVGASIGVSGYSGALIWHSGQPDQVQRWRQIRSAYWISPPEPCCARVHRGGGSSRAAD